MTGMLVVTTDVVPGYRIRSVLGEVVGVTARTHNPFSEGVKGMDGRSNPQLGIALLRWREDAVRKMVEAAAAMGANAIVGMRFDNRWITTLWSEICAYGTAVQVSLVPEELPPAPAAPGAPPPWPPTAPPTPPGPVQGPLRGPSPEPVRADGEEPRETPAVEPSAPVPVAPEPPPAPVSPTQPGSGPATDTPVPEPPAPRRPSPTPR